MNNEKTLIEQIKALTELELESLLKEVGEHLRKNKIVHLVNALYKDDPYGTIQSLEDTVEDLERDIEDRDSIITDLEAKLKFADHKLSSVSDQAR